MLLLITTAAIAQSATIRGTVLVDNNAQELATITISTDPITGTQSEVDGGFELEDIPFGSYVVTASYLGFESVEQPVVLDQTNSTIDLRFDLTESIYALNDIVVTGTKTFKRKTNSPVIVNVLTSQTLDNVQACNLSDGLKFQPGLRVETDCQTCNYTQLRMNGLAGGYSQILINGRPIFSPLTGLYGLEQLPTNMIDRIEVVRGGGSSLYGSSAIGGTVNVITKIPKKNSYEINSFYQRVNGKSDDFVLSGNTSFVQENEKSGISFFFNHRERELYDHNDDDFSELPELENTSIGTNFFFLPTENQKLEISLSNLSEFRYGGEMVDKPAYLTQQSEERTHNVWMGSADYQINFNEDNSSVIAYAAWQNTKRDHYTGIFPDSEEDIQAHIENPPYGISRSTTWQGGFQLNHRLSEFLTGDNTLTLGGEYVVDDIFDEITSYNYLIDQKTKNFGVFIQSDWQLLPSLYLLSGVRMDQHNLVDDLVFNPRVSLLYKYKSNTQVRLNYGTGFGAPQAFDADLHIAFAGGGISRVLLSPTLQPEKSRSLSASINFDKPTEHFVAGFTIEGFYTRLNDAFFLEPIGEDNFGELFEKRNGQGAEVQGVTLELRANYEQKIQIETGFTLQSSMFDESIEYIDEVEGLREFIRTPKDYGFATLSFMPNKKFNTDLNYIYTGQMKVPHFAGAPNQTVDEIVTADAFGELSAKVSYALTPRKINSIISIYGGVKNIFNSYQEEFDIGKNRDSNFVFGPALPRTVYIGLKLQSK